MKLFILIFDILCNKMRLYMKLTVLRETFKNNILLMIFVSDMFVHLSILLVRVTLVLILFLYFDMSAAARRIRMKNITK